MNAPEISTYDLVRLCRSICRRADASATAANNIAQQIEGHEHHVTQLEILVSGLNQLKLNMAKLQTTLEVRPLSNHGCDVLGPLLAAYETAVEVLRMQLTSLRPLRFVESDTGFLMAHMNCTMAYNQLCAFALGLLKEEELPVQNAELGLPTTRDMISLAENAVRMAANTRMDNPDCATPPVSDQAQQLPVADTSDEPPPYSRPDEPTPAAPTPTEPSSIPLSPVSSQRSRGFSFFKALTSGLRKSDPLVSTLCQAAILGDEKQVSGLISQCANINGRNEDGDTPLKCAIRADQARTTRLLLQAGARPSKLPPLFKAASMGSLKVAQMLIDSGESVHSGSSPGHSYFADVVTKGNIDGIRFLLDNGAPVHATTAGNEDLILYAVKAKNIELVRLLLDYGANPNAENILKQSTLYVAIQGGNADMVGLLLDRGASAKPANILDTTILEATIGLKRFELVKKLIDGGADVSGTDMHQQPILIKVIRDPFLNNDEKVEVLRILLDKGANPDTVDIVFGLPAICHAVEMPSTQVVEEILSRGANTKVRMISGQTLLTYSIDVNRHNTVRALLAGGLDVNEVDGLSRTPLMLALLRLDFNLTKLLMDYGADPTAMENEQAVKFVNTVKRNDLVRLLNTMQVEVAAGPSTTFESPSESPYTAMPASEVPPPSYGRAVGKC
ncbi:hypothetical protein F53441_777 [Fusarium austroafricanum]|uniref:Ankyrin repeat protein n=1 Tax=Fusarium austroafricanum TaxID=2364996 RepID=A0A8H4KXM1_9HYPO|nr:hypothetical protein F53441_777 [Fusarium austroafricanum]